MALGITWVSSGWYLGGTLALKWLGSALMCVWWMSRSLRLWRELFNCKSATLLILRIVTRSRWYSPLVRIFRWCCRPSLSMSSWLWLRERGSWGNTFAEFWYQRDFLECDLVKCPYLLLERQINKGSAISWQQTLYKPRFKSFPFLTKERSDKRFWITLEFCTIFLVELSARYSGSLIIQSILKPKQKRRSFVFFNRCSPN